MVGAATLAASPTIGLLTTLVFSLVVPRSVLGLAETGSAVETGDSADGVAVIGVPPVRGCEGEGAEGRGCAAGALATVSVGS